MKKKPLFIGFFAIFLFFLVMTLPACRKSDEKVEKVKVATEEMEQAQREYEKTKKKAARREKKEFAVSTNPKDGQSLYDLEQPIYVYFSKAVKSNDFSFSITPDPGGWTALWGKEGKLVTLEHTNPFVPAVQYELEIRIKLKKIKKIIHFTAYGPSSLQLIEEDERKGLLDLDTAWTYRLQALFEPDALPSEYKSSTPSLCGTMPRQDFEKIKGKLQPPTLKKLKSYLVRPDHPESIYAKRGGNERAFLSSKGFSLFPLAFAQEDDEDRPSGKMDYLDAFPEIRIWYSKGHKEKAEEARSQLEDKNMYARFKKLMGREPLNDIAHCLEQGDEENREKCKKECGGNSRLDIYLVGDNRGKWQGICCNMNENQATPAWIEIKQNLSGDNFGSTLAHELFHAFQFAFDQDEAAWWMEGTAVWAEDLIEKGWNLEHDWVPHAFLSDLHMLETITKRNEKHEYGIYLFPYYLSKIKYGEDGIVARIWELCVEKQDDNSLDAVEKVLSSAGGFEEAFKEFALLNYDEELLPDCVTSYDTYPELLDVKDGHGEEEVTLDSDVNEIDIEMDIAPLSAFYLLIKNYCYHELTPHIRFDLESFQLFDKLTVQAIINPDGEEKCEDWTDLKEREFCINFDDEDFEAIALVIASSEKEITLQPVLTIDVDAEGCAEGECYGTLTGRLIHTSHQDSSNPGEGITAYSETKREIELTVHAVFEYEGSYHDKDLDEISENYELKSWNVSTSKAEARSTSYLENRDVGKSVHHQGLERKRITKENLRGQAVKHSGLGDPTSGLVIVIDAKTGKGKTVNFPAFGAMINWKGTVEENHEAGDRDWDPYTGKYNNSRSWSDRESIQSMEVFPVHNAVGDPERILIGGMLEGHRVNFEDGVRQLGGHASQVLTETGQERQEYRCTWRIRRNKRKGKK